MTIHDTLATYDERAAGTTDAEESAIAAGYIRGILEGADEAARAALVALHNHRYGDTTPSAIDYVEDAEGWDNYADWDEVAAAYASDPEQIDAYRADHAALAYDLGKDWNYLTDGGRIFIKWRAF